MGSVGSLTSGSMLNAGLDVQTIVDGLMQIEQQPVTNMQAQINKLQIKSQAYQTLNTKVSGLLDKIDTFLFGSGTAPLNIPDAFQDRYSTSAFASRKIASSDESLIKATISPGTSVGAYSVTVTSLAQAKTMASSNFADINTTTVGTGTLSIKIGSNPAVDIQVDSTNNTLDGLRKAINDSSAGVTATILNDGTASPYRLLITSNETGLAKAFTVTSTPTGGQALGMTQTVAAVDAAINVNGVDVLSSSNTIDNAIDGVSLTLQGETATPVKLTVSRDTDAMVSAVKDWVTAYNDVNSYINSQFNYNTTSKTAGILSGDGTTSRTQTQIRDKLTQSISNSHTQFNIPAQIGLNIDNDGNINLDETKLRDALSKDTSAVAGLLVGSGNDSILVTMRSVLENITDPLTGPIHYANDGVSKNIKDINDRISAYQDILAVRRQMLTDEYSQADQALKLLSVNQSSLTAQFNSLASLK
jgi:flagellar hook-associated protein 2